MLDQGRQLILAFKALEKRLCTVVAKRAYLPSRVPRTQPFCFML